MTLTDLFDLAARGRLDTAFLSGVQIDGAGRINMSVIGDFARPTVRLPGGAGSAALMPRAKRTILWRTKHDPRVFVERLDFVTAQGNVDRVVTPLCVFRRRDGRLAGRVDPPRAFRPTRLAGRDRVSDRRRPDDAGHAVADGGGAGGAGGRRSGRREHERVLTTDRLE